MPNARRSEIPTGRRDVAQTHTGVPGDAEQRPSMVGEEIPVAHTA